MLPTIVLRPFHYRAQECIGIDLQLNNSLEKEIRKIKGIKWWGGKDWWYLPLSKENYLKIKFFLAGKAILYISPLRQYLEQRKAAALLISKEKVSKARAQLLIDFPLCKENLEAFQKFQNLLILKAYSKNTVKTYTNEFHFLLRLLNEVNVATLEKKHVEAYL